METLIAAKQGRRGGMGEKEGRGDSISGDSRPTRKAEELSTFTEERSGEAAGKRNRPFREKKQQRKRKGSLVSVERRYDDSTHQ